MSSAPLAGLLGGTVPCPVRTSPRRNHAGRIEGIFRLSVDDIPRARAFYAETLGLPVSEANKVLTLELTSDRNVLVYPKGNHGDGEVQDGEGRRPPSGPKMSSFRAVYDSFGPLAATAVRQR
jgi:catechol 2,3-dioxygenase-like lactoylglutathione lyase family enzyme